MKTYTAVYQLDESGWWFTQIKEIKGCHTQGKTLKQARERIKEVLELFDINLEKIKLVDQVELPEAAQALVGHYQKIQAEAHEKQQEAQELGKQVAKLLNLDLKVGMRDTGELMHLSHQRIQQLVNS